MTESRLTRRDAITGAAGAGLTLPLLVACGSQGSNSSTSGSPRKGGPLAKTSDIQVGGGKIFADQDVVVTQPTQGRFKAFSATCTHAGCLVGSVSDGAIVCPCHGSMFSISTGAVEGGPAPSPLPPVRITVAGGQISVDS